jgi:hypothetical protein
MLQVINEEISVAMSYSAQNREVKPRIIRWRNKAYEVDKIGYHHSYLEGRERQHIFEVVDLDKTLYFKLRLDSSNLHWTLEAIHDGLAD